MKPREIALRRLAAQHLVEPFAGGAADVVRSLGAVQAQDYGAAKWAIGQRTATLTDAAVEQAFDDGELIRTHILRPTWHFVAPEDLRWMLALTGPRVHAANASTYRELELEPRVLGRSHAALVEALRGGKSMTRAELTSVLGRAGIGAMTLRRATFLVMAAELDGVVCSGPRRGRQFTYSLVEERVAPSRGTPGSRDDALRSLALRYFPSRGPATAHDFAWWSGLTVGDARHGAHAAEPELTRRAIDGRDHWESLAPPGGGKGRAHLLPSYDEYFIGFRDRTAMMADRVPPPRAGTNDRMFLNLVTIGGQIAGVWRRATTRRGVTVTVEPLRPLTRAERRAISLAAERYGAFMELPLTLETLAEGGR